MNRHTLFSKRVYELNSSGSKKLFVGLFIHQKSVIPGMVLWSEKSEIFLTAQNWRNLMENKAAVMRFFDHRSDVLDLKLDCEHYQTSLKGLKTDLHLSCFYQNEIGQDTSKYMHIAAVSFAWLFGIESAVAHYLSILHRSLDEIYAFLEECEAAQKTSTVPFKISAHTQAGYSLSSLYHEINCYEKLYV